MSDRFDSLPVSVDSLLSLPREALRERARREHILVIFRLDLAADHVRGDPDLLVAALTELLAAALTSAGVGGRVQLSADAMRDGVRFAAGATPAGSLGTIVPSSAWKLLYEKRLLDLPTATLAATRHSGRLGAARTEAGGQIFFLDLPLAPEKGAYTSGSRESRASTWEAFCGKVMPIS